MKAGDKVTVPGRKGERVVGEVVTVDVNRKRVLVSFDGEWASWWREESVECISQTER